MIINLPSDIEKKVDHILISLPFSDLSIKNQLKNVQPNESTLNTKGLALKIRIQPGDANIDFRLRENKSGKFWNFNFNCDVANNTTANFNRLNSFVNKKVVLFIGTSTHRYQIGNVDQPLDFSFNEITQGFSVTINGDSYFPASRQQITSFRSTI